MSVMGALGTITAGIGNAGLGAFQSADFGKKGVAIGALVGLGGYAIPKVMKGDDDSLGAAGGWLISRPFKSNKDANEWANEATR